MIIDTHAHYEDTCFAEDREQLFQEMQEKGIGLVVDIGAGIRSTQGAVELSHKYDFVYAAVGIHPEEIDKIGEEHMDWLRELAKEKKVVAIGEIGLDYHYKEPPRETQKKWFIRQLQLAREAGLPVVIHSREADRDTMQIMQEQNAQELGGVIHCFSYSWETAQIYLKMGFYLGIGGVVTFQNSRRLKEVVSKAPLDRLVLETDAPYLSPAPNRGKRNSSLNLIYVIEEIAALKDVSQEEVIRVTEQNARKLYRLPSED